MNTRTLWLALPVMALTTVAPGYAADCVATIAGLRVDFPDGAQERRLHGTVQVAVRLDAEGRVSEATVAQSSGHASLDRAAAASARAHWRFNIAACSAADLSSDRVVAVTFRRPSGLPVSGTIDRRGLAASRERLADRNCHATRPTHDTHVFACVDDSARERREASR
jgi:TonB family protein